MAEQQTNKNALAAAAAKKQQAAAAAAKAPPVKTPPELDEDFGEDEPKEGSQSAEESEPEVRTRKDDVRTRKDQASEKTPVKVVPTDDFVRDRKGEIRSDEDGDKMRYASGEHQAVGFVNESGVLFPNGYKFKGGHVQNGVVVLNKCPQCGHRNGVDDALSGRCGNDKAGPEKVPCGYSAFSHIEEHEPDDL